VDEDVEKTAMKTKYGSYEFPNDAISIVQHSIDGHDLHEFYLP
jgi:hypothetical protein